MWSPQHYRDTGRQLGTSDDLIERAATATETFIDNHPTLPPILTLGHLAQRTGVSWFHLRLLIEGSRWKDYSYFRIRKRSGGYRQISVPDTKLKIVQRWIAGHVLADLPVHRASFAFAPKSSIVGCARQHCGARWMIKLDVAGFFGSISEIQVYRVFIKAGYSPLVAFELARICTHAPSGSKRYCKAQWMRLRPGNRSTPIGNSISDICLKALRPVRCCRTSSCVIPIRRSLRWQQKRA